MRIGIDISQIVHEGTGVSRYVKELTRAVVKKGTQHTFVLFGTSLRKKDCFFDFYNSFLLAEKARTTLVTASFPPKIMDVVWNSLRILPIEFFTGPLDVFWSSDWIQPPLKQAKGVTTIHDMTPVRFPETFPKEIVSVHKRKLKRSKATCEIFFCDSQVTKNDAQTLMKIPATKLVVIYPGFTPTL